MTQNAHKTQKPQLSRTEIHTNLDKNTKPHQNMRQKWDTKIPRVVGLWETHFRPKNIDKNPESKKSTQKIRKIKKFYAGFY